MAAPKEAWTSRGSRKSKPWGETYDWHALHTINGKVITIRKGCRTSFKYHKVKNEVFFVLSGMVNVTYGNSRHFEDPEKYPLMKKTLLPGETLTVQSECPYRFEAVEESQIIEVGDRPDDSSVMLEDDYGRA